jgi:putative ATP-dependent endonuclease of OLD family
MGVALTPLTCRDRRRPSAYCVLLGFRRPAWRQCTDCSAGERELGRAKGWVGIVIIESITVRHYRAIEEATLDLDPLTYLVGRNGAGKSTFLNALGVFFGALPVTGEGDFYHRDTSVPIEIVVAFADLGTEAETEFARYVRQSRLVVTRRYEWDGSKPTNGSYYGVTGQFLGFAAIRSAEGRDRISAYAAVRDEYDLASARSGPAVDAALLDWEGRHPDVLELTQDDGRFFGYRNVAAGKLDKYIDFVLVPAVRDASADAGGGGGSALLRLVDAVVSRSVALDVPLAELTKKLNSDYETLLKAPALALDELQSRMSRSIQRFAPGTSVALDWGPMPPVRLSPPSPIAQLTDDGFTCDVATKGHGLQRAYMMAALQALAEVEAARASASSGETTSTSHRGLLLAVEEPELFQHPAQARFIAGTFEELTSDAAGQVRVLACTHSPIFVDVRTFDSLRRIQKRPAEDGMEVAVKSADLDQVAQRLQDVHMPTRPYSGAGLRPGLVALMNPYVNEALFADFVVVVEGEEDKALLEASLARSEGWADVRAQAFAVVPVGGKTLMDKMSAILGLLEIPHFLVFDRDGERGDDADKVAHWNKVLGRLAGLADPPEIPDTGCWDHHAVFAPTVTRVVEEEMGHDRWLGIRDAVCRDLGIECRSNVVKNREVLGKMLDRAASEGLSSPSLDRAAEAIVRAVRRDLTLPGSTNTTA